MRESVCERVCVCAIMPVAQRVTCVGPEEIESELEAINLPSFAIRFGLEQNIYVHSTYSVSLCTACFSSLSVFISACISLLSFLLSKPQVQV